MRITFRNSKLLRRDFNFFNKTKLQILFWFKDKSKLHAKWTKKKILALQQRKWRRMFKGNIFKYFARKWISGLRQKTIAVKWSLNLQGAIANTTKNVATQTKNCKFFYQQNKLIKKTSQMLLSSSVIQELNLPELN